MKINNVRYKIIPNGHSGGVMVFDSTTGAIQYPVCWQTLITEYNRLVGLNHIEESQQLLAECMKTKQFTANTKTKKQRMWTHIVIEKLCSCRLSSR